MPSEKDTNIINKDIMSFKGIKSLDIRVKFTFCYKKASKLLKVIYLLTDNEIYQGSRGGSLRDSLISNSHLIVRDTIDLFTGRQSSKNQLEGNILYNISLLDASSGAHLISEANAAIIAEEYQKLLALIDGLNEKEIHGFDGLEATDIEKTVDVGVLRGPVRIIPKRTLDVSTFRSPLRTGIVKGQAGPKGDGKRQNVSLGTKNNDREKVILDEIGKKKIVTIKDISAVMPSISEKTVQRELLEMVARGVLKKEGERRWSRYSIA